jgi:hypothetical protein
MEGRRGITVLVGDTPGERAPVGDDRDEQMGNGRMADSCRYVTLAVSGGVRL